MSLSKKLRKLIDTALIHGMGAEFDVSKRGETATLILEQHPSHRTALYPDIWVGDPDWMYEELKDLLGRKNTCKDTACVMDIFKEIKKRGYQIKYAP